MMITVGQSSAGGLGLFDLGLILLGVAVGTWTGAAWQFLYEISLMTDGTDPWRDAIPKSERPGWWRLSTWGLFCVALVTLPGGVVVVVAELLRNPSLLSEASTEVTIVRGMMFAAFLWHSSWHLRDQVRATRSRRLPAFESKNRLLLWRSMTWVNAVSVAVGGLGLGAIILCNVA